MSPYNIGRVKHYFYFLQKISQFVEVFEMLAPSYCRDTMNSIYKSRFRFERIAPFLKSGHKKKIYIRTAQCVNATPICLLFARINWPNVQSVLPNLVMIAIGDSPC